MKIKQLIESNGQAIAFHIDEDGSLIVEMNGEMIEVPYSTASELIEYLRSKLIDHHNANSSILKTLFR
jgi:hypothetical protein